jgi:hypothetical protein
MGRKGQDPTLVRFIDWWAMDIRADDRLITLNALKASDEISEEQSRQVSHIAHKTRYWAE